MGRREDTKTQNECFTPKSDSCANFTCAITITYYVLPSNGKVNTNFTLHFRGRGKVIPVLN